MMKKTTANIFLILALMLLTIVMVSCGGNSGSEPEGGAAEDNSIDSTSLPRLVQVGETTVSPCVRKVPKDANGNDAAVIEVCAADVSDMVFQGDLILDKKIVDNIKWQLYVYVPTRQKEIIIYKPGYMPYHLVFREGALQSKKIYHIEFACQGVAHTNPPVANDTANQQQSQQNDIQKAEPPIELPTDHQYVDLGLPSGTIWATCNIGAKNPSDCGHRYAWGETKPKKKYSWNTYKYSSDATYRTLTKYCTESSYGLIDNRVELEPIDDAATANWGGYWCMPTYAQFEELMEKCTWEWTTFNGKDGFAVYGPNGNSLFLPENNCVEEVVRMGDGQILHVGFGAYWSSSLESFTPRYAWHLYIDSSVRHVNGDGGDRCRGFMVRPVWCKK